MAGLLGRANLALRVRWCTPSRILKDNLPEERN